jgi:hypothetical protein
MHTRHVAARDQNDVIMMARVSSSPQRHHVGPVGDSFSSTVSRHYNLILRESPNHCQPEREWLTWDDFTPLGLVVLEQAAV